MANILLFFYSPGEWLHTTYLPYSSLCFWYAYYGMAVMLNAFNNFIVLSFPVEWLHNSHPLVWMCFQIELVRQYLSLLRFIIFLCVLFLITHRIINKVWWFWSYRCGRVKYFRTTRLHAVFWLIFVEWGCLTVQVKISPCCWKVWETLGLGVFWRDRLVLCQSQNYVDNWWIAGKILMSEQGIVVVILKLWLWRCRASRGKVNVVVKRKNLKAF